MRGPTYLTAFRVRIAERPGQSMLVIRKDNLVRASFNVWLIVIVIVGGDSLLSAGRRPETSIRENG